ncbi:glycosyltransferase family 2 protein [Olleya marilimosa]|uniref:Glycosyltransferase family 2 protein n=1 Tax=Olleya marilimosa TaxID=272164 RepID=A0ABR8LVI1_9FLAO|nr:glycosyltransferase [Olleya marilimosa]MBD3863596.1 glycosyltransferase family 2 protein [Olleya marilimosa]MBD3891353.1 glycosyltransferase family 2 protein [Olleya marilimosa]
MNLSFSLVICTYIRPEAILTLLKSVALQTLYPNEILVIDGSTNLETETVLSENTFHSLSYFKVDEANRGLTKQRNFGISKVGKSIDIVCFLDDDVVLEKDYFEQLITAYQTHPQALAVGGYITNEVNWEVSDNAHSTSKFYFDNWMRNEPSRFKIRAIFGLQPDTNPGFLPTFAHGRSVSFLPPSGKIYKVEQLMGGVSSYKKEVFKQLSFSTYFEGYGLYEDADFSIRLAKLGPLYINTNAKLAHYHDGSGRPNQYKYGKMVVRNSWYVWRVKYPNPTLKASFKFYATELLLMTIRATNIITSKEKLKALTETLGRMVGLISLIFNKPKIE